MNKNNAGERKRTVTVVIGPKTEAALAEIGEAWRAKMGSAMPDWTNMAGVAIDAEIKLRQKLFDLPVWSHLDSHFD